MVKKSNRYRLRIITMYLIVLAILLDSSTMYKYITSSPIYGTGFGWMLGFLCVLYVVQTKKLKISKVLKCRFPMLLLFLAVYLIATGYNVEKFLVSYVGVFTFLFIFAYAAYQNGDIKAFLHAFSNVMIAIAILSLFFWLFGSILNMLPGRKELSYYWADRYRTTYSYFYLYFENPSQNVGHGTVCNLGIFPESPGYSGFLTYTMLIELVLRKEIVRKKHKREALIRIAILMITLFSTNSTKGMIVVLIALAIEYISGERKNKRRMIVKAIGAFVLIGAFAFVSSNLLESKLETSSGIVRMDDLRSGFLAFLKKPIFGVGYNNADAIITNQLVIRKNNGLSMGLTVLLAYGGIWMFGFYLGAAILSYKSRYFRDNRKTWFLVFVVLLYNLFISNSAFSDPYIFVIAAAYAMPNAALKRRRQINVAKSKKELSV